MQASVVMAIMLLAVSSSGTPRFRDSRLDRILRKLMDIQDYNMSVRDKHHKLQSRDNENDDDNDEEAIKHIKDLEKGMSVRDKHHKLQSRDNENDDDNDEEAIKHIKDLEKGYVDPDSELMGLISSFQVLQNGKKSTANEIQPENSMMAKLKEHDGHVLTHEQKVQNGMESEKEGEGRTSKRGFTTGDLWPYVIVPYEINTTSFADPQRAETVIKEAIQDFDAKTCVRFKPHTPQLEQEVGHNYYVMFFMGSGCWSSVGKSHQKQHLSLGNGCLGVGIAIHEMLHAVGQWHEQSRTDRDYHVKMRWELLGEKPGGANYGKHYSRDYYPYDYESIMQYGAGTGMEFLQPELSFLTSEAYRLSFYDVADITKAYRCTDGCVNPPVCQNGGLLNFKCECYCPKGLTGTTCEEVENGKVCGGIINLIAGKETQITSPNYPRNYDVDTKCVWLLKAPAHLRVRVDVDVFHLPPSENNRCYHWLEVRNNLVGQTGVRKCGMTSGDVWVTSPWGEANLMLLIFDSVYGKAHFAEKGFSLRARPVDKGCIPNPCVYGECQDCNGGTFTCQCDPGFEGILCDKMENAASFECTFERSSKCFMQNIAQDDFDWLVYSGPTPSDLTGPDMAQRGDNYIYAEGSSPRDQGDKAVLESLLDFPADDYCMSFYYNMFGADMGSLTLTIQDTNGMKDVWAESGNQGSSWKFANISITLATKPKIQLIARIGNNWESDIALDEVKITPGVCEEPKQLDCLTSEKGISYRGTTNVTKTGRKCQEWSSNTPHHHTYHEYDSEGNFCRNIRGDEPRPWCYINDPDDRWDFCDIPLCEVEECKRSHNGYDYRGHKTITEQGHKCKPGEDGTPNYCRADANSPLPWCYIIDEAGKTWDTCVIPQCTNEAQECIITEKGVDYFGKVNKTKSGKTCQSWSKQSPHQHGYWSMDDQGNYCRNPDGASSPWCFTTDPDVEYEYCDIPFCDKLACSSDPCLHGGSCENTPDGFKCTCRPGYEGPSCKTRVRSTEDCKRSEIGYEYDGQISTTLSNYTCQRWDSDTPHKPNVRNEDAENYCRNSDKEPQPWCYTTDPEKRWEVCDIPFCTTLAKECVESEKGAEYFGTVRHTKDGILCQKWSEQTPHSHSYQYIGDQDNYCRNPYGEEPYPWCYTVDSNKRWDFCSIPRC